MIISQSKYADLSGQMQPNLSVSNPTFYGIGPTGERRCLEEEILFRYEPEHDYKVGAITMRDGTKMATSSELAEKHGWIDLAEIMRAKNL